MQEKIFVEKMIAGIGSVTSLILHTIVFVLFFYLSLSGTVSWSTMLLVLTTIVSLEAIYLAIFIQMTVNRHAKELADVSEDVEDIQEDIEEISQDVDEIQKDVDEIQEDVEEINEEDETDEQHEERTVATLEKLTRDVERVLADLEQLKKG
jgi:peptidoglycan hydrolase CwlO-like protein